MGKEASYYYKRLFFFPFSLTRRAARLINHLLMFGWLLGWVWFLGWPGAWGFVSLCLVCFGPAGPDPGSDRPRRSELVFCLWPGALLIRSAAQPLTYQLEREIERERERVMVVARCRYMASNEGYER